MATIDLSNYSIVELKNLQLDIENQIKARQQEDMQKAREQILAISRDVGVSIEELLSLSLGKIKKEKTSKVPPQYQHPEDRTKAWSGRGRQPRWLVEALAKGKSLADFKV